MNDGTQIMNFCAKFFNDPRVKNSDEVLNECNSINLRDAQFTRAAIIVHEASHTYYTMRDGPPSIDVAYGYTSCTNLPLGLFDRSCVPYGGLKKRSDGTFTPAICPNQAGGEGFCNGDMSARNADTYSHVAAGVYFSRQCNRAIPYPQPVTLAARAQTRNSAAVNESAERETTALAAEAVAIVKTRKRKLEPITAPKEARHPHDSRRLNQTLHEPGTLAVHQSKPRANSCPYINDFIVWDGNDEGASGITGYAHFGDSYASGMGTGTTSGDKCRVGSNNYGDLIYQLLNDKSISYERRSCSGDTTDGLYNKIDAWGNAAQVTVATLTMGGNDLGFADLVYYCVITPNTAQPFGSVNRKWCVDAENKARDHMNDMSDNGLRARLKDGYLRILRKSGRRDLNMYVAGYPVFFNEETTDCDQSSFHYLFGGYKPPSDWPFNRIVYLTRDLRKELDDLVRQLNSVIQDAISDANTAQGGNQVHFVDVVPAFSDGLHRWCEEGVHEPDSSRSDTWFFLSAWPDAGDPNAAAAEAAELQAMFAQGPIALPDANSCNTTLGANPDPYAVAMCNLAQTVRDAPDGPEAQRFGRANADLSSGNFNSQDVPWYAPTRQVKTFHPRTSGMIAYRDAIFKQIQANGQR
ncbi:SGNH hydrolase [Coniochaeta sp. PMI_546]|nr:SGNH hydrolase [Coniochaeta sp. PMI_546]